MPTHSTTPASTTSTTANHPTTSPNTVAWNTPAKPLGTRRAGGVAQGGGVRPKMLTRHQPGGFMPPPHQTAPLPPMYQHAHVNAHTTTHNPFNDKHPSTRSSNNQDTPTAQHQPHRDATTNTPPQPTTPPTHAHDTSSPPTTTTHINPPHPPHPLPPPHPHPHHRPPTPTSPAHPRQQPSTSTGPTPAHNRAHPNNHAAADNRSRRQQTQERRRTAPDRPHPSQTIARKRPTTQTSTQNKPAGQDRGNGGNNR